MRDSKSEAQWTTWVSPETSSDERAALLVPFPADRMRAYPISPRMNSPRNDDPAIIEPVT